MTDVSDRRVGVGAPHGGRLVDPLVTAERAASLTSRAAGAHWPDVHLDLQQLCDLEMLAVGAFSPLEGFLGRDDYESVCESMRLASGELWPVPVMLDVADDVVAQLRRTPRLCLRGPDATLLAVMQVEEVWRPNLRAEAAAVFGTSDELHPGVRRLLRATRPVYVAGPLEVLRLPPHRDYAHARRTPGALRDEFARRGWHRVVAFQTRNPMHRAHQELTLRAARDHDAKLLVHPIVGVGKPGDVDVHTRVRCYEAMMSTYPPGQAMLSLLPLAMRMAGPREAVWHTIIRKNYGATHFIVGRDHAGPGADADGRPFYGPYDSQALAGEHAEELGMVVVPYRQMMYVDELGSFVPEDQVPRGAQARAISGTRLRRMLSTGEELPAWFTDERVAAELRRRFPPIHERGFTVFLTGLSGSGKSTVAKALEGRLRELTGREVTQLDGDLVRATLSSGLGFSRQDRDLNIRRIALVASEITRHRGIAICAPIAPYEDARAQARASVEAHGGFLLVHVATPLEACEARDVKGLYAQARAGRLPAFTGVSAPYEEPTAPDVVIDTSVDELDDAVSRIVYALQEKGLVRADPQPYQPSARSSPVATPTPPANTPPATGERTHGEISMTEQLDRAAGSARTAEDTCHIYMVRHGTTTMNVQNRYRGRRDVPLDAQGYQDAVDAARALGSIGLAAVYTGPLRRTIATAQIIADEARVPDLRILHGLNNVDYGVWEGMTAGEAAMFDPIAFELYRTSPTQGYCPLGERLSDAQDRLVQALLLIGERHRGECVAAVSHAVMVRLAVARLTGVEGPEWRIPVGRGSFTHLTVTDGSISVSAMPLGTDVD